MLNKPSHVSQETWAQLQKTADSQNPKFSQEILNIEDRFHVDLSRMQIPDKARELLVKLANEVDIERWREKMFQGDTVNKTENRAVKHTHSRDLQAPETLNALEKMRDFVTHVHQSGKYTDIVNLGTGGSHEGPKAVCEALKDFHHKKLNVHFISNIDPTEIEDLLTTLTPSSTLFLVASKSFTTFETMQNANLAKEWLGSLPYKEHFVALTAKKEKALNFGISENRIFMMEDSIGGRFSLWSCIGLSIALQIGFENFEAFLKGAHRMDQHFCKAEITQNAPILLALYGLYHRNFQQVHAHAILPYHHRFSSFIRYVQQLEMESNGKSVDRDGHNIAYKTAPVVFGGVGSNAQHSFLQLLHQGTDIVSTDFIAIKKTSAQNKLHHNALLSSMMAQSIALGEGSEAGSNTTTHNHFAGGRPTAILTLPELSPYYLGMLFALYEHKVFCQGIFWNINSFDQWGVELGKKLAQDLLKGDLSLPAYLE